jgi:broad specificity phosphatase PhoE
MAYLILVKHAQPNIDPHVSPHEWGLSSAGRSRCEPLAQALSNYRPARIITSQEPKAEQTARLLAEKLRIPFEIRTGLEEHSRRTEPFGTLEAFRNSIDELFRQPRVLVYGEETGQQAFERFAGAIWGLLEEYPDQNLVVAAHGTVISLFVAKTFAAKTRALDGFELWKRLGLPSYVVLYRDNALAPFRIEAVVEKV